MHRTKFTGLLSALDKRQRHASASAPPTGAAHQIPRYNFYHFINNFAQSTAVGLNSSQHRLIHFSCLYGGIMLRKTTLAALLALAGFGLGACDVDQTQEGSVTLPEYDVDKTQEGNVTPPKAEVTPPDVDVGETQRTVEVPKIETEQKTVEVPTVDVDPAPEKDAANAGSAAKEG